MKRSMIAVLIVTLLLSSCQATTDFPKIDRYPPSVAWHRGPITELPTYDPMGVDPWQVDLRFSDLSSLDLSESYGSLLYASFDAETVWPPADRMPAEFDREEILDLGKNPGLGVRNLHARGITGEGVAIAIIDQTLLADHSEYADQVRLYEEMHRAEEQPASMHGPAVASIAVGETTGVAPGADLYYIATTMCTKPPDHEVDFACLAEGVDRIVEINGELPENRKIRVLSMAIGWMPDNKGFEEITAATARAREQGMLTVCSSVELVHGFRFHGLGRHPQADPEDPASYEPGSWWAESYFHGQTFTNRLLVPMDSRTTASPHDQDEYVFYRQGGWSWSIPYIAGLYALSAQVYPDITPELFWALALSTGDTAEVERDGRIYTLGPIVNPGALIDVLETY